MPKVRVTAPDGAVYEITAPDGATDAQIQAYVEQNLRPKAASPAPAMAAPPVAIPPAPAQPKPMSELSWGEAFKREAANSLPYGALRGAKDVIDTGAEWLAKGVDKLTGSNLAPEIKAGNDAGKRDFVEQTGDGNFAKVGRVGGNIAATWPIGGMLAAPVQAAGRVLPVLSKFTTPLAEALTTGGMRAGPVTPGAAATAGRLAARTVGGATVGGASAAVVNPEDAGTGAVIGAVLPSAVSSAVLAGKTVGQAAKTAFSSRETKAVTDLAKALELQEPQAVQDAIARLRAANELVPGSRPTVAQALQTPQSAILEKVVGESQGGSALQNAYEAQRIARLNALEGVAPTAPGGFAQIRADVGNAISRFANNERQMADEAVNAMYRGIDPAGQQRIPLPVDDMRGSVDRFLGPGSFGKNADPRTALSVAQGLSKPVEDAGPAILKADGTPFRVPSAEPRAALWTEVNRLRSSINEAWNNARNLGDDQVAAALGAQKASLDKAIENGLSPDALARFQEANASYQALMQRFQTGPQASIFATRNGQPLAQGGEVASLFWGNRPGLAEDVDAFRRLIQDNQDILGRFRSMLTTEAAGTQTAKGQLSDKFVKWVDSMKPGLRKAFSDEQVALLERIAEDVKRSNQAIGLAASRGGSDTYMKAQNALNLGLLESPVVKRVASFLPFGDTGLAWAAQNSAEVKARRLAELLADSGRAADALSRSRISRAPSAAQQAARQLLFDPAAPLVYRTAPVLSADR